MEILERKEPSKNWSMDIICKSLNDKSLSVDKYHCGSKLRINATDVKNMSRSVARGTTTSTYCVSCPVCGEIIELDKSSIPNFIKLQAERIFDTRTNKR